MENEWSRWLRRRRRCARRAPAGLTEGALNQGHGRRVELRGLVVRLDHVAQLPELQQRLEGIGQLRETSPPHRLRRPGRGQHLEAALDGEPPGAVQAQHAVGDVGQPLVALAERLSREPLFFHRMQGRIGSQLEGAAERDRRLRLRGDAAPLNARRGAGAPGRQPYEELARLALGRGHAVRARGRSEPVRDQHLGERVGHRRSVQCNELGAL